MADELLLEDIKDNIIVIKINQLYHEGMSADSLYEVTRGIWKIKIERASKADYALAVYMGIVKEVYQIDTWYPAGTTKYNTRTLNPERCIGRAEFVGSVAHKSVRDYYIGRSVAPLFKFGEANPVKVIERQSMSVKQGINKSISFNSQVEKCGLNIPDNWIGDPRKRFSDLVAPLLNGTEYWLKNNTTDSSGHILEVYNGLGIKRIMGISGKRDMSVNVFFNPDLYKIISAKVDLPGNQKAYRSQPHMNISLEKLWDVICALTGKNEYMISPLKIVNKGGDGLSYGSFATPENSTFHAELWRMFIDHAKDNEEFNKVFSKVGHRKYTMKTYFDLPWRGSDLLLCASYRKNENIVRLSVLINYDHILNTVRPFIPAIEKEIGHIEKNHEYIRYVIPRGVSFNAYTEEDMTLGLINWARLNRERNAVNE